MPHQQQIQDSGAEDVPVEEEALAILEEYAESEEIGLLEAAEDATTQWTQNWCESVPFSDGVSHCEAYMGLLGLASQSDMYRGPSEIAEAALETHVKRQR